MLLEQSVRGEQNGNAKYENVQFFKPGLLSLDAQEDPKYFWLLTAITRHAKLI